MALFDSLLFLFSETDDPGLKKMRDLKRITKEITKNKYHKFYKIRSEEVSPVAGAFFYDIYKSIFLVQSYMKSARKSDILKQIIIENFMSKELWDVYKRLSPESIKEQAKTLNSKDLSQHLQQDLNIFSSALKNKKQMIDRYYNLIQNFTELAVFDFFSLLKKMDPRIREGNFSYQPNFRSVNGNYLVENIQGFLDIAPFEATKEEWDTIFEILKKYKTGKYTIDPNRWKKLLITLQDIHRSDILVLMVRHIKQNPKWQRNLQSSDEYMTEAYIKDKKIEVQACISRVTKDKLVTKRDALAEKLFGNTNITRLQYYTNAGNEVFTKKNIAGFTHIPVLNYLKSFLLDYYDILDLYDLFLIRGQWRSQELSRKISQGIYDVTNMAEELAAFDADLADTGINGIKLKNHLNKYKLDKGQIIHLKATLNSINSKAKELADKGIASFTLVGTYLKALSDDYGKNQSAFLVNWKDIQGDSKGLIAQRLERGYKTVSYFVILLRLFIYEE